MACVVGGLRLPSSTSSAVLSQAALVVRPTCKVNGKGRNLTPNDIKIPDFFFQIWTWSPWLRPWDLHHCKFFISIRSEGASPQISEILWFCDFSWLIVLYFLLEHAPRSNTWMNFHGLWLIRHAFTQGRSFFCGGLRQYWNSFGVISPKTPQKGRE